VPPTERKARTGELTPAGIVPGHGEERFVAAVHVQRFPWFPCRPSAALRLAAASVRAARETPETVGAPKTG